MPKPSKKSDRVLEDQVRYQIRQYLGSRSDVRVFSNPVGNGWVGEIAGHSGDKVILMNARRMKYGLFTGSSDLIGWITINDVAVFFSPEIKSPTGKPSQAQLDWIRVVKDMGGIAGVVRSVKDVEDLIEGYKIEH